MNELPICQDKLIRDAFQKIKLELQDHLEAINETNNEIAGNYEYIQALEHKIDKLSERLEEISMLLNAHKSEIPKISDVRLTSREQQVFLVLYTSQDYLSYPEVAKKLGLTVLLVGNYITNMLEKGIPIIKRYVDNEPHVTLDPTFKELQTKEGIVKLNLANC
jgi:hypothetical protein